MQNDSLVTIAAFQYSSEAHIIRGKLESEEVLASISEYSINNEGERILCPKCGGSKIDYFSSIKDFKSLFSFLFGFLFSALPFYVKYKYRC